MYVLDVACQCTPGTYYSCVPHFIRDIGCIGYSCYIGRILPATSFYHATYRFRPLHLLVITYIFVTPVISVTSGSPYHDHLPNLEAPRHPPLPTFTLETQRTTYPLGFVKLIRYIAFICSIRWIVFFVGSTC